MVSSNPVVSLAGLCRNTRKSKTFPFTSSTPRSARRFRAGAAVRASGQALHLPVQLPENIQDVGHAGAAVYEDLTKYTGGKLFESEADTALPQFLEVMAQELKNQYVLGFKSTNDARDDKWRKLEIKIKAPEGAGGIKEKDMKPKARDRYFVAKVK